MTQQIKFYVKHHRQRSVHVTPTCAVNGLLCDTSSGWTLAEWCAFVDPLVDLVGGAAVPPKPPAADSQVQEAKEDLGPIEGANISRFVHYVWFGEELGSFHECEKD